MKIHMVTLGCAKNTVDTGQMISRLLAAGMTITEDPETADTIVVNTCGFIEPAIDESIDTILEMAAFKNSGVCRNLIVAGCLAQRFGKNLADELPEVDTFLGTGAFNEIVKAVRHKPELPVCHLPDPENADFSAGENFPATLHDPSPSMYLKIAEGCDRKCTYCIIPRLRGRQKSRPLASIISEVDARLRAGGLKEIILIAQETSSYGKDLAEPEDLNKLLQALSDKCERVCPETWIRILYQHPESIGRSVIQTMAGRSNICPYFDIPIQHVDKTILKRMGRHYSEETLYELFSHIRSEVPQAALRTTLLLGFPGEREEDFQRILDFVERVRFDHLGAFIYSDFEDLVSHRLSDPVDFEVAQDRYDRLMALQMKISEAKNRTYLGATLKVLVEEASDDGIYLGRTAFQAPEIDGLTYIRSDAAAIGSFINVKIIDALEYDLIGVPS